jgi:hypothetical protein
MRGRLFQTAVCGVSVTCLLALPARADISLLSSSLRVGAYDGQGGSAFSAVNPASLPYFNNAHDIFDGQAFAKSDYDFTASGDTGAFRLDFDHARTDQGASYGRSFGDFRIMSTNNVNYSFDGDYTLTGTQRIYMQVRLHDETLDQTAFHNVQESRNTPNESFTLGEQGGDTNNALIGNISGTLTTGHVYRVEYFYLVERFPAAGPGATALGDLNLNISPIPAPGAALLAMLGVPMIGWFKRRRARLAPANRPTVDRSAGRFRRSCATFSQRRPLCAVFPVPADSARGGGKPRRTRQAVVLRAGGTAGSTPWHIRRAVVLQEECQSFQRC